MRESVFEERERISMEFNPSQKNKKFQISHNSAESRPNSWVLNIIYIQVQKHHTIL